MSPYCCFNAVSVFGCFCGRVHTIFFSEICCCGNGPKFIFCRINFREYASQLRKRQNKTKQKKPSAILEEIQGGCIVRFQLDETLKNNMCDDWNKWLEGWKVEVMTSFSQHCSLYKKRQLLANQSFSKYKVKTSQPSFACSNYTKETVEE